MWVQIAFQKLEVKTMSFRNIPPNGFPALPDVEDLEAVVKDVTTLKSSVSGLTQDVSDLNAQKANQITIAPFFNAESSYDVGDLVYYNGLTYRCTNAHEGEWDADDFAGTTIANELDSLKSGLTNLVKRERFEKTTDSVGDFNFTLPSNSVLVSIRPLRMTDHYSLWWGAIIASTIDNTGYSCKAIKDDGTPIVSEAVMFDVYYI